MYIMNLDRNDANILVKRKRNSMFFVISTNIDYFHLIPIDHGYSLPDVFEINELSWCWQDWKQIKEPWDPRLVE